LFAYTYPSFSSSELKQIEQQNRIAKNRILHYEKTLQKCKKLPKEKQLQKINFYINGFLAQYDAVIAKKENYWSTPKEFLKIGYGDCEDYVIMKYYSLIKLGFDEKKLFLTIVKEKFHNSYHMVLSYFSSYNANPLILDNLSFKILKLSQRNDLEPIFFINSSGVYKIQNHHLKKVAKKYKDFENLRAKVAHNL
jgi:predicted transglutaminase-like cysteine proteinase